MTHRIRVTWSSELLGLGDVLERIAQLGYEPQPLSADDTARPEVAEQRNALKRLLVAFTRHDAGNDVCGRLVCRRLPGHQHRDATVPATGQLFCHDPRRFFFAAKPFFVSAWRGVAGRMPGMDLPVSIAIGLAYTASVYSTFSGGEAVWFDSVAMFVFFLTLGRYLEMRARHRSVDQSISLSQVLPNTTTLVNDDGQNLVPVNRLKAGDIVLVRTGDAVPADGCIVDGESSIDESLLTGESEPQRRQPGDRLAAGSVNLEGRVLLRVESTGNDTALGAISRLSERARYARPGFVQTADRIASYIVIALLLIATGVAMYWYSVAPERAFAITLSVLVVTCPCALALATPAAFATAGTRLSQLHLLLTNGNAIEALAKSTHVLFDKTGTLTSGRPAITATTVRDEFLTEADCLRIASALEQISSHPLAQAFRSHDELPEVIDPEVHIAMGVSGEIDGARWKLGSAEYVQQSDHVDRDASVVFLQRDESLVAEFVLQDEIRDDAHKTLQQLRQLGLGITLASGDNAGAVREVAVALSIDRSLAACTPADKLELIRSLQSTGERVVMVGDGINDAPVLAGADVSIAPVHGALLAQTNADIVMLGESLQPLITALHLARRTMRIVRQNLGWAIAYNVLALPLAATGYVPPWAAAIGMSASSLIVVLNALRLSRYT